MIGLFSFLPALLQQTLGSLASGVKVLATEFNSADSSPGKESTSLVNGLFIADSIGSLLESGYSGGYVYALRNGELDEAQLKEAVLMLSYYAGWGNGTAVSRGIGAALKTHRAEQAAAKG